MNGISNVNTQSIHKVSKSIVSEMQPDNTVLPPKSPNLAISTSEICKYSEIWWSTVLVYLR